MDFLELVIIAIGLSMDAFAVSICKGLSLQNIKKTHILTVGLYFGGFQAFMPLIGYFFGMWFKEFIISFDHWLVFVFLTIIGVNMIREALDGGEIEKCDYSFNFREMIMLSLATSIDALAIGVGFAFLDVDILPAITVIGVTTFIFSAVGTKIGNVFGEKYKTKSELVGGIILILIGIKILIEHLFI